MPQLNSLISAVFAHPHKLYASTFIKRARFWNGIKNIEHAGSLQELISCLQKKPVDLIILDDKLSCTSKAQNITVIKDMYPQPTIIVLTERATPFHIDKLMAAGANAIVHKATDGTEIKYALNALLKGDTYCCPQIMQVQKIKMDCKMLSAKETEVLLQDLTESCSKQILLNLSISTETLKSHRRHINEKIGKTILDHFKYAYTHGLISESELLMDFTQ